jgi:hypothetical protein
MSRLLAGRSSRLGARHQAQWFAWDASRVRFLARCAGALIPCARVALRERQELAQF